MERLRSQLAVLDDKYRANAEAQAAEAKVLAGELEASKEALEEARHALEDAEDRIGELELTGGRGMGGDESMPGDAGEGSSVPARDGGNHAKRRSDVRKEGKSGSPAKSPKGKNHCYPPCIEHAFW